MRIVLPGDVLAKVDERLPGEGVYKDGEVLRSEYLGVVIDDGNIIKVKPFKRPPVPRVGSIVVGYVMAIVRGRYLQIQVYNLDGELVQPFTVVAKVPDDILSADAYARVGDFVRAKIIDDKKLVATLEGEDLGVILALCSRCNYPLLLEKEENAGKLTKLRCPICGNEETRKTAKDYNVFAKLAIEKSIGFVMLDTYRQIPFEMRL